MTNSDLELGLYARYWNSYCVRVFSFFFSFYCGGCCATPVSMQIYWSLAFARQGSSRECKLATVGALKNNTLVTALAVD